MHDQLLDEIERGEGLQLSQLAKRLPPTRRLPDRDHQHKPIEGTASFRPVSLGCLLRWVLDGVKLSDGTLTKLEAVRLAGRWISSPGALRRFIAAQTPKLPTEQAQVRTPRQRLRASERAARRLEEIGI